MAYRRKIVESYRGWFYEYASMPRPSKSIVMARSAKAAMLAAIEIYNKTAFEYREEAFCILMINAWEVLLKARIVDRNGNRLEKIYLREKGLRFKRSRHTGSPLTISLERALSECDVPASVQTNIETLYGVRNEISHLGPHASRSTPEDFRIWHGQRREFHKIAATVVQRTRRSDPSFAGGVYWRHGWCFGEPFPTSKTPAT